VIDALFDVLRVAGGFLTVMVVWIAIQAFVRRKSSCGRDRDMLDFMLNGCGACANKSACSHKKGHQ
jgi:hypothetical protein